MKRNKMSFASFRFEAKIEKERKRDTLDLRGHQNLVRQSLQATAFGIIEDPYPEGGTMECSCVHAGGGKASDEMTPIGTGTTIVQKLPLLGIGTGTVL
jgi:hypothetical protein